MVAKVSKRSLLSGVIIILMMITYTFVFCVYSLILDSDDAFPSISCAPNQNLMWVTFGFTMAMFTVGFVASVLAFERKDLRSRVFGVPIVIIGYAGILIQIVIDLILMVIGMFVLYPEYFWMIALIPEGLFFMFVILTIVVRQAYRGLVIEKIDAQQVKQTYIKELRVQLEVLAELNPIESLDRAMNKIYEKAKYADPVSCEEIEAVEDEISAKVGDLRACLVKGQVEEAKESISAIEILLDERAARAKLAKK